MKLRSTALILLFAVSVLVACRGTSFVPQTEGTLTDGSPVIIPNMPPGFSTPDITNICAGIPFAHVPGSHILMFALGNLSGGNFSGTGLWFLESFKIGKPGPTPTPGVTPTPIRGTPVWIYYGKYTLKKKKETGCAFLEATKSGKPFKGSKGNAVSLGTVITNAKHLKVKITTTEGPVTITFTGVSATGGKGSAKLITPTGGAYDTATITLVGRILLP